MLRRLASPLREFGTGAGLLYLLDRALSMLSPRFRVFAYELVVQPVPQQAPARRASSAIEVQPIVTGDSALALMPVPPAVIRSRLEQGCACVGAFRKGQMIGYMWYRPAHYEEDEVRCSFVLEPPGQSVFDFDFYIFPEHRMGRGFAALWEGANQLLAARGVHYSYSRVSRFNNASRRAHAHLGASRIGLAVFLRLWTLQLTLASVRPRVHLGFSDRSRPRLTLSPEVLIL